MQEKKKPAGRIACLIAVILAIFLMPFLSLANHSPKNKTEEKIIKNAREFLLVQKPLLALVDAPFLRLRNDESASGVGTEDLILDLLYPSSGRTKYVQYIPRFGKNKMYYRKLKWELYETDHISLFVYDPVLRDLFISLVEETYSDLARTFQTESFDEKLRIYIYRDRRDFSQMNFGGIDTDGILGVTHDLRKWHNKIAFLFEGEKSELFEVARHEMVHRFNMEQIYHESGQDMLMNPPLWFVEGMAVSYSINWSATHEWVARDAYYNKYLEYGILPEGRGTFLPYVTGTMVVNYIKEKYGTATINAIIKDSAEFAADKIPKDDKFDEILKKYTGLDTKGLYEKTVEKFEERLRKSDEDIDIKSSKIANGRVLAVQGNALLRIEGKYLRYELFLSKIENGEILKSKKIAVDGKNKTENLKFAAALSDTHLAYVTFQSGKGTDVLRVAPYSVKKKKIKVGKYREFYFPNIIFITSPVFTGKDKIAFVGLKNGLTNVFLLDLATKKAKQLTNTAGHISGLDYSPEKDELIFSRESEERIHPVRNSISNGASPNKCDFNYDLYLLNLKTNKETKVVETPYDELSPQWLSKDRIIFMTDEPGTYGLSIYDIEARGFRAVGSVRITATSPKVINENTVIFRSTKYLASQSHLLELSSIPIPTKSVSSVSTKSVLSASKKSVVSVGNTVIKNEKLFVTDGEKLYPVKRFAAIGSDLYFDVEVAPGKTIIVPFNKKPPEKISVVSVSDKSVVKFRDTHAIMWEGISSSNDFVVFVVNNRLNWTDKKRAKKYPVTVYVFGRGVIRKYDFALTVKNSGLLGKEEKTTRGFHSAIELNNDYILMDIGGGVTLFDLSGGEREYLDDVVSLKISPDKRFVAWTSQKWYQPLSDLSLSVLDTQTRKISELGKFDEIKNLHFNGDNELVWSKESGWRWKNLALRIYIWNSKNGTKEIKVDISTKSVLSVKKKSVESFEASSQIGAILLVKDKNTETKELYLAKPPLIVIARFNRAIQNDSSLDSPVKLENDIAKGDITNLQLLRKNHLFFKVKSNRKIKFFAYDIKGDELRERINLQKVGADETNLILKNKNSTTIYDTESGKSEIIHNSKATAVKKGETVTYAPPPPPPKYKEGRVQKKDSSKLPFDVKTGWGVGSISWAGKNIYFMGLLDIRFHDLFEDGTLGLFWLGTGRNYNIVEVSYLHRPSGNGLRIYYDQYFYDHITGSDFFHVFRLNKFQRIVLGGGYKFQLLANFFPPDYRGLGNVLAANASYTFDTTHHLLHGPQGGFRLYLATNAGYNIDENDLNNLDLNLAWRQYFNAWNMVSFAYRLEGGTSLGVVPTWYGIGGNMTLRGIPFLSVWGNTYAIAGTEVRFDILYYVGAVFKEPLTPASFLFLTILPQFGWFADVGTAFYWNPFVKAPYKDIDVKTMRHILEDLYYEPNLYWSTGPFVNLPYLPLGMILRFNWSVAGNYKYWNFWFGFNW